MRSMEYSLFIWSMLFCFGQHAVLSSHFWEDLHHRTAFGEILDNLESSHSSWRYSIENTDDMVMAFGGLRRPRRFAIMENRTAAAMLNEMDVGKIKQHHYQRSSERQGRRQRYADDSIFRGKPKTREERWHQNFNMNATNLQMEQAFSLVTLLNKVVQKYMKACIPIVFYDSNVERSDSIILQILFQKFQLSYLHGKIDDNFKVINQNLLHPYDKQCRGYILFVSDVLRVREVLGPQTSNRVVVVPQSTQWKLQEFLASKSASDIINLLLIGESLSADPTKERPYVLYTHKLYTDGLGSNAPIVLTSWIKGKLSRPHVNLFPMKFQKGFSGHRFLVTGIHQPPFVLKELTTDGVGNVNIGWDGLEIRLLKMIGQRLNFTYEIVEPKIGNPKGPTYGIIDVVAAHRADIGVAGAYVSNERLDHVDMSTQHSGDCAAFITLASKALPRYRAIMGPFQWPVWLAIIATYLLAIIPLAYSDRLTLRHLIGNWGEIENMFWYVFGTFTNSLTFTGEYSWSRTRKTSTRMLIGWYWVFSIIITACYTSSIIAFVTLPVFPDTVDSVNDLVSGFFRVGTFAQDGWQYWFSNSSHPTTRKLLKDLELVSNVEEGLGNVTKSFFWSYAFLASRAQLEYIVQNNFTDEAVSKRSALHIGEECLAIFGISLIFPRNAVYSDRFNDIILRLISNGLVRKINTEMEWDLERSGTGKLLQSNSFKKFKISEVEERKLNLADTEGMFLLMGVGYLIAGGVLVSEIVGGCATRCRQFVRRNSTITSLKSSFHPNTSAQPSTASRSQTHPIEPATSESSNSRKSSLMLRFRRKSEQAHNANNDVPVANKHKRNNSLVVSDGCGNSYWRKSSSGHGSLEKMIAMHQTANESEELAVVSVPVDGKQFGNNVKTSDNCADVEGVYTAQTIDKDQYSFNASSEQLMSDTFGEKVNRPEVY